jgi:micrococcal nuclease
MSTRAILSILACLAIAASAGAVYFGMRDQEAPQPTQPNIERTAVLSYVVDGDTIVLVGGERVRLVGIDAPELGEPGGSEAKQFVEGLCQPGEEVGLNGDDLKLKDRYNRTLAVVYVMHDDSWINLNAELLRRGHAEVYYLPPSEFNPYRWLE